MEDLSVCIPCIARVLLLLTIANGLPVLAQKLFGARFATPVDLGAILPDGRPLFGHSKTWRGLASAVLLTALAAPLLDLAWPHGAAFAALVMSGDLTASFLKRRLGYAESSRFRLLDVIPEALFPVIVLHGPLGLSALDGLLCVLLFFAIAVLISPVLYRWHIRRKPY